MSDGMIERAKSAKHVIVSLVQPQKYGLPVRVLKPVEVLSEKRKEIDRTKELEGFDGGRSFWYYGPKNCRVNPIGIRSLGDVAKGEGDDLYCVFVGSPYATSASDRCPDTAKEFSEDGQHWREIPKPGMLVTGRFDGWGYGMVLDRIEEAPDETQICVWRWSVHDRAEEAIVNDQGCSTHLCDLMSSERYPGRMYQDENGMTQLVGVARLAPPYAIWLR